MSERMQSIPVGVVLERRCIDHLWQDYEWRPVSIVPGAGAIEEWKELDRGDGWVRYLAASMPLELHRKETESYKVNLSNEPPVVYVVLSESADSEGVHEVAPTHVTVSAFEAQDYLDSGETMVEGVPMPVEILAWVEDFVERHHVDEPFVKRKRKRYDPDAVGFGRKPKSSGQ